MVLSSAEIWYTLATHPIGKSHAHFFVKGVVWGCYRGSIIKTRAKQGPGQVWVNEGYGGVIQNFKVNKNVIRVHKRGGGSGPGID